MACQLKNQFLSERLTQIPAKPTRTVEEKSSVAFPDAIGFTFK